MSNKPTIICIDHDATMRNLLKVATMILKVQFVEAESVIDGLTVMKGTKPDLILLNPNVRGGNGWEFVSRMRGHKTFKELPIIVISANSAFVEQMNGNPVDEVQAYFPKPFSVRDLKHEVKSHLPSRSPI